MEPEVSYCEIRNRRTIVFGGLHAAFRMTAKQEGQVVDL